MLTVDEHLSLRHYYPSSPYLALTPPQSPFCFTLAHLPKKNARVFCFASRFSTEGAFPDVAVAYDRLTNACIAETSSDGTAQFQLRECPGVYRNSSSIQPRHVHLVFWDVSQNQWEMRVYTKPIDVFLSSLSMTNVLVLSLGSSSIRDDRNTVPFSFDDTAEDFCEKVDEMTEYYFDTEPLDTLEALRDRPVVLTLSTADDHNDGKRMKDLIAYKKKIEQEPWRFCNVFLLL